MIWSPLPYSLRQLQYALAVAETRSFRRAALRCRVSQPSLSIQLAGLEQALGVVLFERNRRGVRITPAGQAILERARAVLRESEDLLEQARRAEDPLAGPLRIGVIPTVSPYLVPRVSAAFRRAHRELMVRWVEDKTEILVERLEAGELDTALLALEAELGATDHEVIGTDPFVLVTPRDHPLGAREGPARLSELRDTEVLLLDDGHCLRDQALAPCARARARELEFRATSLPTLVQMVASGEGVTLLPQLALATETRRARLRVRPFAPPAPGRTLGLIWRRGSPLGPALRTLAATARRAYPADAPRS